MSCCEANEYGFKCSCRKRDLRNDEDYGDWLDHKRRDEQGEDYDTDSE